MSNGQPKSVSDFLKYIFKILYPIILEGENRISIKSLYKRIEKCNKCTHFK